MKLLPNSHFFQINRGIIINMNYITGIIGDQITLENGMTVYISRGNRKNLSRRIPNLARGRWEYEQWRQYVSINSSGRYPGIHDIYLFGILFQIQSEKYPTRMCFTHSDPFK